VAATTRSLLWRVPILRLSMARYALGLVRGTCADDPFSLPLAATMDYEDITLHELRIFSAFSRTEHLGRAAEELRMSAPAVQRAVRSLESRLGVPLVHRDGRRLRLLDAGRVLAEQAEQVLDTRDEAFKATLVAAGHAPLVVRLGYLYSLGLRVVPDLITRLTAREPEATARLYHGSTVDLVSGVLAGELDAACIAPLPNEADLKTLPLFSEGLLLCVPKDDPLARRESVAAWEVRDRPFAVLRPGFGTRDNLLLACARAGFRPAIAYEANDIFTVEGIVGAGLAVSLLPARITDHINPRVALVPLRETVPTRRTVGLVYHRAATKRENRALKALIDVARSWDPS
jgi:LysR family transcriptional activator of glutamate synthase operon